MNVADDASGIEISWIALFGSMFLSNEWTATIAVADMLKS